MRVATIFAYLIGRRRAILDIAADRKALVVAAMLVLAAALARNYDRASLMDEPWRLLGPFAASLAISGPLFLIISRGVSERSHPAVCPRAKGILVGRDLPIPVSWREVDGRTHAEGLLMKSPFPGMDPSIEACGVWADFHDDLIAEIKRSLAARLPERYFVQTGERSFVVIAGTDEYEAEPGPRLVTCIEVLSPANKHRSTQGWKLYLRQRNALLLGKASLVEIDLVRSGRRMPMVEPWPQSPYYLMVGRESDAPYCRVWPAHFHRPLPEVPVPLVSPDPDIPIALQPMVEAVYERSRYARRIDYSKPLSPPLSPEESAWLAARLSTPRS